jgi:hypothetical protein
MRQLNESKRTVALYDDDLATADQSSGIVAIYGTPGETPSLIGAYSIRDHVPKAHLENQDVYVIDLPTALHIFHFKPRKTGAQSL